MDTCKLTNIYARPEAILRNNNPETEEKKQEEIKSAFNAINNFSRLAVAFVVFKSFELFNVVEKQSWYIESCSCSRRFCVVKTNSEWDVINLPPKRLNRLIFNLRAHLDCIAQNVKINIKNPFDAKMLFLSPLDACLYWQISHVQ